MKFSATALGTDYESGVTTIEFALVAFLLFGIVGALIDMGFGWWKYSNLTSAASTAARMTAQTLFQSHGESCAAVGTRAATNAMNTFNSRFRYGRPTFTGAIQTPNVPGQAVRVSGTMPLDCIFCMLLPNTVVMRTQADALIEHGGFRCSP